MKNVEIKTKQASGKTRSSNERSYVFTDEALEVLAQAKSLKMNLSTLVSRCVAEYGAVLFDKSIESKQEVTVLDKLDYLESAVKNMLFDKLIERFVGDNTLKAHQDVIEQANKASFVKLGRKLNKLAKENELTKSTKKHEWQTIVLFKDKFLKLK